MKKYLVILLCFISSVFCFAEDFKGFLNIPFGTPAESVKRQMISKGYKPLIDDSMFALYSSITYGGKKVSAQFDCSEGYLCQIDIFFNSNTDAKDIYEALVKKYNLIKSKDSNLHLTKDSSTVFELDNTTLTILTTESFSTVDFSDL